MGRLMAWSGALRTDSKLADVDKLCGRDMGICDSFYCISLVVEEG